MMDMIVPFSLFNTSQKGRMMVLDEVARSILVQHDYPFIVNHYLLELMALAGVMGADQKTKALTTIQVVADKDSPISTLVVDIENEGGMRAYARFSKEAVQNIDCANTLLTDVFKNGHMLFNIDFEQNNNRYQAAVDLSGKTLTESMAYYCKQSDQIPSQLLTHIANVTEGLPKGRLALGIMLQQLPLPEHTLPEKRDHYIDEWMTSLHFLNTLKSDEALNSQLTCHDLLYRLFHDAFLQEYTHKILLKKCCCSLEKVEKLIGSFPEKEQESLIENGQITVDCEFCSAVYKIDAH